MRVQQSGATVEKAPGRGELEAKEKKVKILEHQRREVRTRLGGRHCQGGEGNGQRGHVGWCGETGAGLRSCREALLEPGSPSSWSPRCFCDGRLLGTATAGLGQGLGSHSATSLSPQLLEVNKQWDQHFRAMKQKYEQKVGLSAWGAHLFWLLADGGGLKRDRVQGKVFGAACASFPCTVGLSEQANVPTPSWQVTDLHQELAEARRALTELESEREQKQRDFDRKLLLAKSRIETEEASPSGRVMGRCWPYRSALADLPAGSCRRRRRGWPWR